MSKMAFSHANLCYMLTTEYLLWLLGSASLLKAHCCLACQCFALSFHYTAPTHQTLLLGSTCSFLRSTNVSLNTDTFVFTDPSFWILAVFQVEHVWLLLSTACTAKPCKPLVLLWFHCQWNHQDCMVSISTHCPFKMGSYIIMDSYIRIVKFANYSFTQFCITHNGQYNIDCWTYTRSSYTIV